MTDEPDETQKELPPNDANDSMFETSEPQKPVTESTDTALENPQLLEDQETTLTNDNAPALDSPDIASEHRDTGAHEWHSPSEIAGIPSRIGLAAAAGIGIAALGVFALVTRRSKLKRAGKATVLPFVRNLRR